MIFAAFRRPIAVEFHAHDLAEARRRNSTKIFAMAKHFHVLVREYKRVATAMRDGQTSSGWVWPKNSTGSSGRTATRRFED